MDKNLEQKIDREFEESLQTEGNKKLAFWTLIIFFGGFVIWATLVPLDEGVPTMGKVVVETKRKAIQHSTGGTIKEIYVKEGDFVELHIDHKMMGVGGDNSWGAKPHIQYRYYPDKAYGYRFRLSPIQSGN